MMITCVITVWTTSDITVILLHNVSNFCFCPCSQIGVSSTAAYHLHVSCSYPVFENPYPMDIHESPVTCTAYFADCPPDIIPILYSIGAKHKKTGYSLKVGQLTYTECAPFCSVSLGASLVINPEHETLSKYILKFLNKPLTDTTWGFYNV